MNTSMKSILKAVAVLTFSIVLFAILALLIKVLLLPILPTKWQTNLVWLGTAILATLAALAGLAQLTGYSLKDLISNKKVVSPDLSHPVLANIKAIYDNSLGKGIRMGGIFDGVSLQIVASDWERFGPYGYVTSGWLWPSTQHPNHAITFFKILLNDNGTGYAHIMDVSDPPHIIWLTTSTNNRHEDKFCWSNQLFGIQRVAYWEFTWQP